MRLSIGLLIFSLGFVVCRETSAYQAKSPNVSPIVSSDNRFAMDLYARLDDEQPGKNLFFSPTSISLALAMAAAGAHGPTQSEMATTLHLGADLAQAHAYYHQLLTRWNAVGQKRAYELRVANRLWGAKGFAIRPEFLALTRQQYGAEMTLLNFAQAAEASQEINQWIGQQTNGKINDLIPPDALGAMTRLVLTNAVYFKGDWVHPFDKQNTHDDDFRSTPQSTVKAPFMHQETTMRYAEDQSLQALEMPYAGNELSMLVLLPKKADGLSDLEKAITVDHLASLTSTLRARKVIIDLPKFKLDASFSLSSTLEAMGMKLAFSRQADFSGITESEPLTISAVLHKAYVDVTEEGTEAAAATGVVMRATAVRVPEPLPEFRADHPFLFLIRDSKSGNILFMGRLISPVK